MKHIQETCGRRHSSRDRSRSRGRSRSRSRELQSGQRWRREEERSPWSGRNDRSRRQSHNRRDWSDSTRRSTPEESPLTFRSTMQGRNEGRGRGWDRSQGKGGQGGHGGRDRGATSMHRRGPYFLSCQTMVDLVSLANCSLDSMSNRDIAAFWSALPRLLHKRGARDPNLEEKLRSIIDATRNRISGFQSRDLAQSSLGIAKTVGQVGWNNRRYRADDPRQILWGLL